MYKIRNGEGKNNRENPITPEKSCMGKRKSTGKLL